jgi:hypothetical protein
MPFERVVKELKEMYQDAPLGLQKVIGKKGIELLQQL